MRRITWSLLGVVLSAVACSNQSTSATPATGGTLVIATAAEPDQLFPVLPQNTQARAVTELIYDYLAELGPAMNVIGDRGFRPQLAQSWSWASDSLSIAFHINPKARWHDGVPVRAGDVWFTYALNTGPVLGNPMGETLRNLDSVSVRDSLTPVFWFHSRSPKQFYNAAGQMLILPEHIFGRVPGSSLVQAASQMNPVGSGRFRFARRSPGASLELAADSGNYRGSPRLDRVIWSFSPEFQSAIAKLLGGEADLFDALHLENVAQVGRNPRLRVVVLSGMDYNFLQFNLRDPKDRSRPHPILGDRELRRALSMALDRAAMVRNVFDTLGAVSIGPTIRALPTTSPALMPISYDTARAGRILDSLGWKRRSADGIRARGGKQLAFAMLVPTSSSARMRYSVLIQSQLARAGVRVSIEQMDFQSFRARQDSRDFDAALSGWHVAPDPAALMEDWSGVAARKRDGRNYGGYENPAFDAVLDSALSAGDSASSFRLYNRAYQMIIDDAPAVWLYEPKTVIGVDRRFRTTGMRPDAWWTRVGDWWVPQAVRIPRDRVAPTP